MPRPATLELVLAKLLASLKRDFLFETSYKLQFAFQVFSTFMGLITFYFLSRLIDNDVSQQHLAVYGCDYFTFVLVGLAFLRFFNVGMTTFTTILRQYMTMGVLEAMMATRTSPAAVLLYSLVWPFCSELLKSLAFLLVGVWLLGADLVLPDLFVLGVTLALIVVVFTSVGLLFGSFILLFKRGDPLTWAVSSASQLVGGVMFPVTILPDWLQRVAYFVPVTHALEVLRRALIGGATMAEMTRPMLTLAAFAAVLVPVSCVCVSWALGRAKVVGGLAEY